MVMFIFDIEVLFFTPTIVFLIGINFYLFDPEKIKKKITLKYLTELLMVVFLFVFSIILIRKFQLFVPLTRHYRIIGMAFIYLLCTVILWRDWLKARRWKYHWLQESCAGKLGHFIFCAFTNKLLIFVDFRCFLARLWGRSVQPKVLIWKKTLSWLYLFYGGVHHRKW